MCKTVEEYAKEYAKEYEKVRKTDAEERILEERKNAIRKLLKSGSSREFILSMDYSETELEAVEQELLVQA